MRSGRVLPLLLVLAVTTAGCAGLAPTRDAASDGAASTTAPLTSERVALPDVPKERPDRPSTLNVSAVREYVRTYEYRYAYNSLWVNEYTEVRLECRVDSVTERSWGYEAVVTCTGHSNTRVPENATVTPGPHADWFTQSYRYLVSEDATRRRPADDRGSAS